MKILFITLSNIGDAILTLPVLDFLRQQFPEARISCLVGERPKEIFENNPAIEKVIVFNKRAGLFENIKLFNLLKKENFDIVIDLRNSLFGRFLPAKYKTPLFKREPQEITHMHKRHLSLAQDIINRIASEDKGFLGNEAFFIRPQDKEHVINLLERHKINEKDNFVVISPGARSHIKRWPQDKFCELINRINSDFGLKVVLAGDASDTVITKYINERCAPLTADFAGKTNISQLACLLKRARLVITNDSAVLHLASYLNTPVVAVFGPTNEIKYGPWSKDSAIVKKNIFCRPCEKAQCKYGSLECMSIINVEDVLKKIKAILGRDLAPQAKDYSRILVVRTDRIGDVLLSTPVLKALRDKYPEAYIAMMVSPYAKDIVEANPNLDKVIIFDKDTKHRGWLRSYKFAMNLKKQNFDLAIILHPTNRVHLITFFAGISKRVGYDRKLGFLLTDKIKHTKQFGEKHELEYNLDLVRYLGIEPKDKTLYMPIRKESEEFVDELFKKEGLKPQDKLLAIHPGASCPSKIWPAERFAEAAEKLAEKYHFKILIVAGPKDAAVAEAVQRKMHLAPTNLAGKTSVSQLASVLKRCTLFISNDSGPVHVASAVGTPVISLFGRAQAGLSPKRWEPVGMLDEILHKDVGCIECLAHNCKKEFACLKAISVDEVVKVANTILSKR